MKSKLVNLAAAMALSFLAIGQAKADAVSVTYYNNFVENPGVGISFSDSFLMDSISGISELRDIGGSGTPNFPSGILVFGADYTATIIVPTSGTYTFGFGSDDAGYLFVGGNLIGFEVGSNSYPGLVPYSVALSAGDNSLEVQFDNKDCCGAVVALQLPDGVSYVGATPLPAALPLFAGGLGALGLLVRRKKRKNAAVLAAA